MTSNSSATRSTPATGASACATCSSKLARSGQPATVSAIVTTTSPPSIRISRTMSSSTTLRRSSGSITCSSALWISSRFGSIGAEGTCLGPLAAGVAGSPVRDCPSRPGTAGHVSRNESVTLRPRALAVRDGECEPGAGKSDAGHGRKVMGGVRLPLRPDLLRRRAAPSARARSGSRTPPSRC